MKLPQVLEYAENIIDLIYPVGSIYMSVNNVSPSTFLGGEWEQIKDRFLLSAGDSYTAGSTGGSSTSKANVSVNNHTLSINQIPAHHHNIRAGYPNGSTTASGIDIVEYDQYNKDRGFVNDMLGTSIMTDTGGSQPHNHGVTIKDHNNMPPYLTVYCWKRIA